MKSSLGAGVAIVAVALGIGLTGCGSDTDTEATTTTSPTETTTETTSQPAPEMTVAEYIQQNNIVETPVHRGDPGAPTVELPIPPGWQSAGNRAPADAYDAFVYGDPTVRGQPSIIAYVVKLTGDVDPAKILEYAPAEIQRLPGYDGPKTGSPTQLGPLDATQIGGSYLKDDVLRAVGQMTAVMPVDDGLYVVQLNVESPGQPELVQQLTTATAEIALRANIAP